MPQSKVARRIIGNLRRGGLLNKQRVVARTSRRGLSVGNLAFLIKHRSLLPTQKRLLLTPRGGFNETSRDRGLALLGRLSAATRAVLQIAESRAFSRPHSQYREIHLPLPTNPTIREIPPKVSTPDTNYRAVAVGKTGRSGEEETDIRDSNATRDATNKHATACYSHLSRIPLSNYRGRLVTTIIYDFQKTVMSIRLVGK